MKHLLVVLISGLFFCLPSLAFADSIARSRVAHVNQDAVGNGRVIHVNTQANDQHSTAVHITSQPVVTEATTPTIPVPSTVILTITPSPVPILSPGVATPHAMVVTPTTSPTPSPGTRMRAGAVLEQIVLFVIHLF